MRCISIWQPFATLLVKGFKVFETRSWAPPRSLIGQRIGIASTKVINPAQRQHFDDPNFRRFYDRILMPDDLIELPHGYLLGTAVLDSYELMTPEFLEDVSEEEKAYGWWAEGRYAWRMVDPAEFEQPVRVRGQQGVWVWHGNTLESAIPVNIVTARRYNEVNKTPD